MKEKKWNFFLSSIKMFILEIHGGLGNGEDAEGGYEGGHQLVGVVPSQTRKNRNEKYLRNLNVFILYV